MNVREILENAGNISKEVAKELGVSVFRCRFAIFTVRLGKAIKKILG